MAATWPKSLDALLGQSYEDFELIISDNASTDDTSEICRDYESQDARIRYCRQPRNIGSSPNHNFVVEVARGELFKWASYDDLYARELLERCVDALDEHPDAVLAHSWTANIDEADAVFAAPEYPLATDAATAPERFRSVLFGSGGDDIYAVIRTSTLRRVLPQDSYHHAENPIVAALSLHGPFLQVPDWLYFRRDHPQQAERACATIARPLRQHGPAAREPIAAPGGPLVRGVPLGLRDGNPPRSADIGGTTRVLWTPRAVVGQPGEPSSAFRRPSTSRQAFPPSSTSRPWLRVRPAETDLESGTKFGSRTGPMKRSSRGQRRGRVRRRCRHAHDTQAVEEGSRKNLGGPGYRLSSLPFALNQSSVVDNPSSRLMGL